MATLRQLYDKYGIGTPVTWHNKKECLIVKINSEIFIDNGIYVVELLWKNKIDRSIYKSKNGIDSFDDFEYDYKNMPIMPKNNKKINAIKNPNFPQAMTLADVMNMKTGDIFYLNHSHLKTSTKCIFSYYVMYGDDSIIFYSYYNEFSEKYFMYDIYMTDCGVTPYRGDNGYHFNESNYLTKERVYEEKYR